MSALKHFLCISNVIDIGKDIPYIHNRMAHSKVTVCFRMCEGPCRVPTYLELENILDSVEFLLESIIEQSMS